MAENNPIWGEIVRAILFVYLWYRARGKEGRRRQRRLVFQKQQRMWRLLFYDVRQKVNLFPLFPVTDLLCLRTGTLGSRQEDVLQSG